MAKEYTKTHVSYAITYPAAEGKEAVVEELFNEVETSKSLSKRLEEAKAKGATVEQTRGITFKYTEATSVDDFLVQVTAKDGKVNEEEAVNIWNRGLILKQQKEAREVMESDEVVEGIYDLTEVIPETAERRKADPMTKAARDLKKAGFDIDPALLAQVLAQFAAKPAVAAPAA